MSAKNVFDTMRLRSGPWKIGSGQRRQGASYQFYLFLLKVQWTFKNTLVPSESDFKYKWH